MLQAHLAEILGNVGLQSWGNNSPFWALFQGEQLNPPNPFPLQTAIIPSCRRGDAEGERCRAPRGTKPFKHVPQKDEQPRMAKQTDGGRRREAHDTGETTVISVISSNHSSTAAFPSLSARYAHRHNPTAEEDFDTRCTLNFSASKEEVLTRVNFSFHAGRGGEHVPALPAPAPRRSQRHPVLTEGWRNRV